MGGEQRAAIAHMAHVNAVPHHHHHQRTTETKKYVVQSVRHCAVYRCPTDGGLHGGSESGVNGKRARENTVVTLFVVESDCNSSTQ